MAKKPKAHPVQFHNLEQMDNGIRRLKEVVDRLGVMMSSPPDYRDPTVSALRESIVSVVERVFGQDSRQFEDFQHHQMYSQRNTRDTAREFQISFVGRLAHTKSRLEEFIHFLEGEKRYFQPPSSHEFKQQRSGSARTEHNYHGTVNITLAGRDINTVTIDASTWVEIMMDAVEKSNIPQSEKEASKGLLSRLLSNDYFKNISSSLIAESIKAVALGSIGQ